jgi:hypothetical protein
LGLDGKAGKNLLRPNEIIHTPAAEDVPTEGEGAVESIDCAFVKLEIRGAAGCVWLADRTR